MRDFSQVRYAVPVPGVVDHRAALLITDGPLSILVRDDTGEWRADCAMRNGRIMEITKGDELPVEVIDLLEDVFARL